MSACISRHGEFSEHTLDDSHTCTLCGVLDEDALRAELVRLRATERQYTVGRQRIADLMGWCARELGASNVHKAIRHFLAIPDAAYPWHVAANEPGGDVPVEPAPAVPGCSETAPGLVHPLYPHGCDQTATGVDHE